MMAKGSVHVPEQYESKAIKVAEGTYIQNIVVARKPDLTWIAVNNISVRRTGDGEINGLRI